MKTTTRDPEHLAFIRTLPCVACTNEKTQAAHIRKGTDGGTGLKPSDYYTVPMCASCHFIQHEQGEITFWYPFKGYETAKALAKKLYSVSGDTRAALDLIGRFRSADSF